MTDLRQDALEQSESSAQRTLRQLGYTDCGGEFWKPPLGKAAQPEQQAEPVGFYVYKPTLPRGSLGSVSDGDLPWVYDQDPSSGYAARMFVYTTPPQRQWVGLTDEEILSTDPWEILRADPWMGTSDSNINPYQILLKVRTLEAKLKERNT